MSKFKPAPGATERLLSLVFFVLAGRAITYAQPGNWWDTLVVGMTLYWGARFMVDDAVSRSKR